MAIRQTTIATVSGTSFCRSDRVRHRRHHARGEPGPRVSRRPGNPGAFVPENRSDLGQLVDQRSDELEWRRQSRQPRLGFGLVDAHAAARLAETWTLQSTAANEQMISVDRKHRNNAPLSQSAANDFIVTVSGHYQHFSVEWVELDIALQECAQRRPQDRADQPRRHRQRAARPSRRRHQRVQQLELHLLAPITIGVKRRMATGRSSFTTPGHAAPTRSSPIRSESTATITEPTIPISIRTISPPCPETAASSTTPPATTRSTPRPSRPT